MAKSVDLTKVHVRNKLSATSSDPVPYPLAKGHHLLYRPSSRSWGLRWISSDGKRQFKWFGTLPDTPEHAKFDLARELAKDYFEKIGGSSDQRRASYTVLHAVNDYIEHLEVTGGNALDAKNRAKRHIYDKPIRNKLLIELTSTDVAKWRKSISGRQTKPTSGASLDGSPVKRPATINRDIVLLKSALNLAFDNGLVHSQAAWRGSLKPAAIPPGQGKRSNYFTKPQREAFVAAIERTDIRHLVNFLCRIPLRPSAAALLRCSDLDPVRMSIRINDDKGHGERYINLQEPLFASIFELTEGKAPRQYVFGGGDIALTKDSWKKVVKKAAISVGFPLNSVLYDIRHSVITDLLAKNTSISLVAQISGTSERMIEKTYSKILQTEESRVALAILT